MKIDRSLNLVMEIPRENSPPVLAHAQALPHEIFSQYFDLCGPTYNALLTGGYGYTMPRYAAMMLRKIGLAIVGPEPAVPDEAWQRARASAESRIQAFFAELHRLTYVLALKNRKWEMILLDDAAAMGAIDEEELSRIDGALCFFTCASQSVPREQRPAALGGLSLFNARTESSSCMEFMRSLPTSMTDDSSGESQDSLPASSSGAPGKDSSASSRVTTVPGRMSRPSAIALSSVRRVD